MMFLTIGPRIFIYGFDPKFIMAITAKVNMVLHGDGSAHIFKYDAFFRLF